MAAGIIFYGATRILQAILLVYLFAGSYSRLSDHAIWWVLLFGCMVLVTIQMITFPIYWGKQFALCL